MQNIPEVFHESIKNDDRQDELRGQLVLPFDEMAELINDRINLRHSAGAILRRPNGNRGAMR